MKGAYILDSYALIAYFQQERGGDLVSEILQQAYEEKAIIYLSEINLGEVYYTSIRDWGEEKASQLLANIFSLPIELIPPNREIILEAARYKARGKSSYADCFVLELAISKKATILTGDPEFKNFEKEVKIKWI